MNAEQIVARLRLFLLAVAALMFGGTVVELLLLAHFKTATQLIPFALCGLGLAAALWALARPARASLLFLRANAAVIALGSLLGAYEHITENIAFQLETKPSSTTFELLKVAVSGANPLLAPGILAFAALLAAAATYYHPALSVETRFKLQVALRPRHPSPSGRRAADDHGPRSEAEREGEI
jgi:hypothetical protein